LESQVVKTSYLTTILECDKREQKSHSTIKTFFLQYLLSGPVQILLLQSHKISWKIGACDLSEKLDLVQVKGTFCELIV